MTTMPLPHAEPLSAAELDRRLERAVVEHERSEKLICVYLDQISRRSLYRDFGYENVYDYATERFGFCRSKTRSLLYLGRRLTRLPHLTEALATGRVGWTKAARVASVATPEDDEQWTERAVASSFRELEREIRDDVPAKGGRVSIYLTAEQASVWMQALELCRKVSGEEIDPGLALEYVAGEFLATYQASADEVAAAESEPAPEVAEAREVDAVREEALCPEEETELPEVAAKPYAVTHRDRAPRGTIASTKRASPARSSPAATFERNRSMYHVEWLGSRSVISTHLLCSATRLVLLSVTLRHRQEDGVHAARPLGQRLQPESPRPLSLTGCIARTLQLSSIFRRPAA